VIEVQNLTKRFGQTLALDNLSFQMNKGEILGFLGPNGAGKTTTIRILTGYLTPTEGVARIAGLDISEHSRKARRHTGYLPETVPIYRELTTHEYLSFVAEIKQVEPGQRRHHLDTVMDQCGLTDVQNKLTGNLSRGYRQRLGLAQALVNDPDILILDEPTTGLDPRQIIEIRELIRYLSGKRTIILSSHILPEVSQICEKVIILNKGRLVAVDTPDNLDKNLSGLESISVTFNGDKNVSGLFDTLRANSGISSLTRISKPDTRPVRITLEYDDARDIRPWLAKTIIDDGWDLLELQRHTRTLEEIFMQLVTQETTDESDLGDS
jgi:ABC-2 type transport system ATP-binding protein